MVSYLPGLDAPSGKPHPPGDLHRVRPVLSLWPSVGALAFTLGLWVQWSMCVAWTGTWEPWRVVLP